MAIGYNTKIFRSNLRTDLVKDFPKVPSLLLHLYNHAAKVNAMFLKRLMQPHAAFTAESYYNIH